MIDVLLVNSGKTEPIRPLETDPELRLSVITEAGYRHQYADDTHVVTVSDIADAKEVRRAALRVYQERGLDFVVAPSERSLPVGGYLRSFFGLPGLGFETANRLSNKYVMKRVLAAAGLPVTPHTQVPGVGAVAAAADQLGWPVVVKPVIGSGSMNTHALAHAGELPGGALHDLAYPLLVERMVDIGTEYHCDGIVQDGTVRFAAVSKYLAPVLTRLLTGAGSGSYTLPDGAPDAASVRDLHAAAVQALGLRDGVTHLEVYRTRTGDMLIGEITARPGGGGIPTLIRHQFGVDVWSAFLRLSTGRGSTQVARPASDHLIRYLLPASPGQVEYVTPAEAFTDIPGVEYARVSLRTGDVVTGTRHSAMMAGIVLLRTDREERVPDLVAEVTKRYEYRLGGVGGA